MPENESARSPSAGLAVLCLSLFIVSISTTIVNLALPSIQRALGLLVVAAGLVLAAAWQLDTPHLQVGATLALLGIGQGILVTPSSNAVMGSLDPADGVEASRWVKGFESEWIETAAKKAFLEGCQLGMEVACAVTLAVLVLVLLALPSRPA